MINLKGHSVIGRMQPFFGFCTQRGTEGECPDLCDLRETPRATAFYGCDPLAFAKTRLDLLVEHRPLKIDLGL